MASSSSPAFIPAWQFTTSFTSSLCLEKSLTFSQIGTIPNFDASIPDQTLVRVLSTSLNPLDYKIVEIPVVGRLTLGKVVSPGMDFVGQVWKTTLQDKGLRSGDFVFGTLSGPNMFGTLGGVVLVRGKEGIARVPLGFEQNLDELACVGLAGLAALQSLTEGLGLSNAEVGVGGGSGKWVFVNGGSGGVGTFALQIAKFGLRCEKVVTSSSGTNAALCRNLGADEVIDYKTVILSEGLRRIVKREGRKFDLIVDNVGYDPELYWECSQILVEGGKYMQVGSRVSLQGALDVMKMMLWPGVLGGGRREFQFLATKSKRTDLEIIGNWIAEGKVKAVIDEIFEMGGVPGAFAKLKSGRTRGKIVVRISDEGRCLGN